MRRVLQIISFLALVVTIIPSVQFLGGRGELSTVKTVMLGATILWFAVAPFAWQRNHDGRPAGESQA